ncbi:MAG: flagellar hook capping FlgD N-terminal domain-containing protein [Pseudomonadota bacterium]
MTSVTPITADQSSTNTATSSGSVTRGALTEDLDTFLNLLVAQLENQDPLEPLDANEFVDQLTQFSELEQGVEQTDALNDISSTLAADTRQTDISYLGKIVEAETDTVALTENGATLGYSIDAPTNNAEIRIFTAGGQLLTAYQVDGNVGDFTTTWDGVTDSGVQAAPGLYRAQVVAISEQTGQERLAGKTYATGTVSEVRFDSGSTELIYDNGITITSNAVRRVATPAS